MSAHGRIAAPRTFHRSSLRTARCLRSSQNTTGYGIGVSTYSNKPYFWTGFGSKDNAPIVKDFESKSIAIAANSPNRVTIRHDGCGTLSLRFESNGKTAEGSYFFEGLLHETKPMYLTFATGTAWADCGMIKISNLSFIPKTADIGRLSVYPMPLQVAADASVSENAVILISDAKFVSATPATLSLAGAVSFDETFTAAVPSSWFRHIESSHILVDFSAADLKSAFPSTLVLKDETGKILDRPRLIRCGNAIKLVKNGFAVILR